MMRKYIEIGKKYKILVSTPFFGFIFSILLFFLSYLSFYASLIIILLTLFIPIIIILYKEYRIRSNQIKNISEIVRDMNVVIKILNKKGDASINSKITIHNNGNNPVEFLYKDIYSTPGSFLKLSKPKIVQSSIENISIERRIKQEFEKVIKIDGYDEKHKYVECDYRIFPPLRSKDYLTYELNVETKEHIKINSNDNYNIEGFIVKNIASFIEMNLISPDKYKLKLIDYWVEDIQANRIDYLKSIIIAPIISCNESLIKWYIEYPCMNFLYLFKYKLVKR
jgi:hypothetical protein